MKGVLGGKYLGYLTIARDQTGGRGTVNALSVAWKMWEQPTAPPEENGQLLVTATVAVPWSSV